MKMKEKDTDIVIGILLLVLSILTYIPISQIRPGSDTFVLSAAFLPMLANVFITVLSAMLIITSIIDGGRLSLAKMSLTLKEGSKTAEFRNTLTAIVSVAILIFVGYPLLGFYISGFIFMLFIMLRYVKIVHPILSVVVTLAALGALYGIFVVIFKLNLPLLPNYLMRYFW